MHTFVNTITAERSFSYEFNWVCGELLACAICFTLNINIIFCLIIYTEWIYILICNIYTYVRIYYSIRWLNCVYTWERVFYFCLYAARERSLWVRTPEWVREPLLGSNKSAVNTVFSFDLYARRVVPLQLFTLCELVSLLINFWHSLVLHRKNEINDNSF